MERTQTPPAASPARPEYRLIRRPAAAGARLRLDAAQQQVVDHSGGPLLVLAGPGTGKTATIVETVAHRIEHRGLDPARVLVLTFSRKAAGELRERIAGRLRTTIREPLALTFHSYAYALVRREFALLGEEPPWTGAAWPRSEGSAGATTGWRPGGSSTGTRPASTWRRCRPTTTRKSCASPPPC